MSKTVTYSVQPLIEMSQACIVEWNESPDVSIPDMADRAGRGTSTSSSASSSSKSGGGRRQRRSIRLEGVRRKLEEQQGTNHHNRNRNRGDQQKNRSSSSSEGSGEEEIDDIFRLHQEDEGLNESYRRRPVTSSLLRSIRLEEVRRKLEEQQRASTRRMADHRADRSR
jgi:hypothetical protein